VSTDTPQYQVAWCDGMFFTAMSEYTQIAERTVTFLVCMKPSAAWALDHESVRRILPRRTFP